MGLDRHRGGSGEPLVLVHGIGHTWRGFKPMLPLLEERFDVLAVDLPGFGHSPMGPDQSPEGLADAVEAGWIALILGRRGRARTVTAISPADLAHAREKELGKSVLLGLRWIIRNVRPPEALLRNPVGRTLLAGPTLGRPGAPILTTWSSRRSSTRRGAAPAPGPALRAPDPRLRAALPEGARARPDVGRPGAAERGDCGLCSQA